MTAELANATVIFGNGFDFIAGHNYRLKITFDADTIIGGNMTVKLMTNTSDSTVKSLVIIPVGSYTTGQVLYRHFLADADYMNHRIGTYITSGQGTTTGVDMTINIEEYDPADDELLYNIDNIRADIDSDSIIAMNGKYYLYNKLTQIHSGFSAIDGGTPIPYKNFTVVQFSDIHGEALNAKRIEAMREQLPDWVKNDCIDLYLHCGDTISRFYENSLSFWTDNGLSNVMNVLGNHDAWTENSAYSDGTVVASGVYLVTQHYCYDKFFSPFISSWSVTSPGSDKCYFYKDFAAYNIRLIVLDCMHEDSAQQTWLTSVLADARTNNLAVIAVQHYKAGDRTPIDCTFTSLYQGRGDTGSNLSMGGQCVKNFIDAGGTFICWINGHTHYDSIYKCTGDPRQIGIHVDLASYMRGTDDASTRLGTPAMDCLNVVSFDLQQHYIKIFRIGRTYDHYMRNKNTLLIDYTDGTVVYE